MNVCVCSESSASRCVWLVVLRVHAGCQRVGWEHSGCVHVSHVSISLQTVSAVVFVEKKNEFVRAIVTMQVVAGV